MPSTILNKPEVLERPLVESPKVVREANDEEATTEDSPWWSAQGASCHVIDELSGRMSRLGFRSDVYEIVSETSSEYFELDNTSQPDSTKPE